MKSFLHVFLVALTLSVNAQTIKTIEVQRFGSVSTINIDSVYLSRFISPSYYDTITMISVSVSVAGNTLSNHRVKKEVTEFFIGKNYSNPSGVPTERWKNYARDNSEISVIIHRDESFYLLWKFKRT